MTSKKILFSLFAVLFLIGGFITSGASAVPAANAGATEILIGFESRPNPATYNLIRAQGWEITGELPQINVLVVTLPVLPELPGEAADMAREALEEAFDKVPGVVGVSFVEENGLMYAHGQTVPWGVGRIGAVEAHDISTGVGISIAILDTGIDVRHEDLTVAGGYATVNCSPGPHCAAPWDDDHGHGTHVAGTAAALNNNIGVLGTAPDVGLYAVKVLDRRGAGTWAGVAEGIIWAADQGIEVLNMSLGGGHSDTVQKAVIYAYGKGSLLVASAGNSGPGEDTVGYPAAYPEVIAVSATDQDDNIASWSSRGEEVEFAAPGVKILSTVPGNKYEEKSGTSMAAPHVAGTAALVWATNLELTNINVRGILQETAEKLEGLSQTEQGFGLVNAAAAVGVKPPVTGSIKGTVTDEGNGAAIAGATVVVEGTNLSATTDTSGYYLLENVPVGEQQVTASANGYYSTTTTVTVVEGATVTQDFALQAIPTYTVSGTVTDTENFLLEGATVAIKGTELSATTGIDGSYSISDVEKGTYDITASKSGYSSQTKNVAVESNVTVDFALEAATVAVVVRVESITYTTRGGPKNDRHLDITVLLLDDLDNPVADTSVSATLYRNGSSWNFRGTTGSNGTVTFSLLNHGSGCYYTEVTAVVAEGLEWDGVTPENGYCK